MKSRSTLFALSFGCLAVLAWDALAQRPERPRRDGGRFVEMEKQALAEDFKGVTTDGEVRKRLFPVGSTGVSTEPVRKATLAFLAGLSEAQRNKTQFAVDDDEWRKWANQHSYPRQGMSFADMTGEQRNLAFAMVEAGLSARGLRTTQDIMKLNGTLGELTGRDDEYTEWLYWITVMGEPSETKPWGWQLDGHHVVLNYFVLGDQVVMTPHFLGSEPVRAESGKFKGTVIMQEEEKAGLEFMRSLSANQQKQALIAGAKAGTNTLGEAFKDNIVVPYSGLSGKDLDAAGRRRLLDLVGVFIGHLSDGHAKVKLAEIERHLDETWFGWIGETGDAAVYYYRIHSPVVLIEFDHQRPIALGRNGIPTRNHIHAVVRTPNGNDYGKDLLRQHLEQEHTAR